MILKKVFFVLVNQLRAFCEKLDLTKWSFIFFSGETTGKLLRRIDDEDMPPGHSDDPPKPGPPGSGPYGGGPYGPVPSQPPVDPDDTPFPMEYEAEIPPPGPPPDGPSGPSAGAVPRYSDPDVPLSHPGTHAPPPSYPPDDPPLPPPPPADSPRTQSPPKKVIPLDPDEQRPARVPRAPVKKSRAATAKAREPVINLPGQQQPAKVEKMPSLPEDGDDEAPHPDAASSNSQPGLPVTEGEFPIAQSPEPDTPGNKLRRIRTLTLTPPLITKAKVLHLKTCFSLFLRASPFPTFPF